jgi:hypothetical protein
MLFFAFCVNVSSIHVKDCILGLSASFPLSVGPRA